jgi:hypothetical protein
MTVPVGVCAHHRSKVTFTQSLLVQLSSIAQNEILNLPIIPVQSFDAVTGKNRFLTTSAPYLIIPFTDTVL